MRLTINKQPKSVILYWSLSIFTISAKYLNCEKGMWCNGLLLKNVLHHNCSKHSVIRRYLTQIRSPSQTILIIRNYLHIAQQFTLLHIFLQSKRRPFKISFTKYVYILLQLIILLCYSLY